MQKIFHILLSISLLVMLTSTTLGQSKDNTGKEAASNSASVGLEIGWYNPSLDYWKNTSPYYKNADFAGAVSIDGIFDKKIAGNFHGQAGIGYWQVTSSDLTLDSLGYGNTNLVLTGVPITFDVVYHLKPLQFSIVTPFVGIGGEVLFIQHKENFENKENPDPQWGSTIMGNATAGFEASVSDQFMVDLGFQYKLGSYKQDFNIYDDSENPQVIDVITEEISLNGLKVGITLRYLF